jgi:hypothetical protein
MSVHSRLGRGKEVSFLNDTRIEEITRLINGNNFSNDLMVELKSIILGNALLFDKVLLVLLRLSHQDLTHILQKVVEIISAEDDGNSIANALLFLALLDVNGFLAGGYPDAIRAFANSNVVLPALLVHSTPELVKECSEKVWWPQSLVLDDGVRKTLKAYKSTTNALLPKITPQTIPTWVLPEYSPIFTLETSPPLHQLDTVATNLRMYIHLVVSQLIVCQFNNPSYTAQQLLLFNQHILPNAQFTVQMEWECVVEGIISHATSRDSLFPIPYYTNILTEMIKQKMDVVPAIFAKAVRSIYYKAEPTRQQGLPETHGHHIIQLWKATELLELHLSQFSYKYPFVHFAPYLSLPPFHARPAALRELFKAISTGLSYPDRIKGVVDAQFLPLVPHPKPEGHSVLEQHPELAGQVDQISTLLKTRDGVDQVVDICMQVQQHHTHHTAVRVLLTSLFSLGSKSYSHLLSYLDRSTNIFKSLFTRQFTQKQVLDGLLEMHLPDNERFCTMSISSMINWKILDVETVLEYFFNLLNTKIATLQGETWAWSEVWIWTFITNLMDKSLRRKATLSARLIDKQTELNGLDVGMEEEDAIDPTRELLVREVAGLQTSLDGANMDVKKHFIKLFSLFDHLKPSALDKEELDAWNAMVHAAFENVIYKVLFLNLLGIWN